MESQNLGAGRGSDDDTKGASHQGGAGGGQGFDSPWQGGPSPTSWGGQGQQQGRRNEGGDRQPRQGGGREGRQDSRTQSGYGRASGGGGGSQRGPTTSSSQRFRPY